VVAPDEEGVDDLHQEENVNDHVKLEKAAHIEERGRSARERGVHAAAKPPLHVDRAAPRQARTENGPFPHSSPPPPPSPSRTNWTRLVPPPVLIGHVSWKTDPSRTARRGLGGGAHELLMHGSA
jgi:hypothetical protein